MRAVFMCAYARNSRMNMCILSHDYETCERVIREQLDQVYGEHAGLFRNSNVYCFTDQIDVYFRGRKVATYMAG